VSFSVPTPLPTREGELLSSGDDGARLALFHLFPGRPLDATNLEDLALLGEAIGELQVCLETYPFETRPGRALFTDMFGFPPPEMDVLSLYPSTLGLQTVELDDLFGFWRHEASSLRDFVDGAFRTLPTQICHNDMTHKNILAEKGQVSAILDFEFATGSPRALDLVQGLRVALRLDENTEPWAEAQHFLRGYRRWLALSEPEILALPTLMRLRAAMTVLWWLGQPRGDHAQIIVSRIERFRRTCEWTAQFGDSLVDLAMREGIAG
jgi:homoserine kinase type II